jgi:predicted negative regulator of RcsB-dependent stress response
MCAALLGRGKRDLAIASYRKALEIDPSSKRARRKLDELENPR